MHAHSALPLSLLFVYSLLAALLIAYLVAAFRHSSRGGNWSRWRSLSFALGIGLVTLALSPPLSHLAHQDLRGHMLQHLLLGMLAPLGLVFGAPVTLLLRNLPVTGARRLVRWLNSRPLRFLSHPGTALVLDMGGMYLLYLTPLYVLSQNHPALHALVHWHFLAAGYLFTWAIAGPDPAPHRPSFRLRLWVLLLGMAAHATLGKLMYAYHWPRNTGYPADMIEAGAQLMYYGGDLVELLLAIALFATWYRTRSLPRPQGPGIHSSMPGQSLAAAARSSDSVLN